MGEEGTEHRVASLEKAADKTEKVLEDHTAKLNEIKILNVRQDVSLNIIVWVSKAILTVFIGLVVSNIWMYLDSR